jgi:hypothetical protein
MKKKLIMGLILGAALLAGGAGAFAQTFGYFGVSSASSCRRGGNFDVTNYWAVVPPFQSAAAADPDGGYTPVITTILHRNDKAAGIIAFYTPGTNISVTITNTTVASGTNAFGVSSTLPGFTAGDKVLIEHRNSGPRPARFESFNLGSVSGTVLTLNSNLVAAVALGDVVYRVTKQGQVQVAASTNSLPVNPGGYFAGDRNKPILVEMDSTAVAGLDSIAGFYGR